MNKKLVDFIPEFIDAFSKQLEQDEIRWGKTWLLRKPEGQEERTISKFNDYFDQYKNSDVPIPWLKIVGNAYICWIREQHPEIWTDKPDAAS